MKTRHDTLMESTEYRRLYAIEGLVTEAAELVTQLMEREGLNKAGLARRLGKSRAWVTQLLSGKANMTIRTFAEVVHALGAEVELSAKSQRREQWERPVSKHPESLAWRRDAWIMNNVSSIPTERQDCNLLAA